MPNIIQYQCVWTGLAGAPYLSTFNFNDVDRDLDGINTAVRGFFESIKTQLKSAVIISYPDEVKVIDEGTGQLIEFLGNTGGAATVGTNTGETLPTANQALIRLKTGSVRAGRRIAGHLYVGGLTEAATSNGVLTGTIQTLFEQAATTLINGQIDSDSWAVWSRPTQARAGIAPKIQTATCWSEFAVLRSRRQ